MAAADYVAVVQQLYISYFGRPADTFGLKNFTEQLDALKAPTDFAELNAQAQAAPTGGLGKLVNSFNSSDEAKALYGTDNSQLGISKFLVAVFQNVLGRDPEAGAGFDFWFNALASGQLTRANAAMAITEGALSNTTPQGLLDAAVVQKKLEVATNFTDALDTPVKQNAYSTVAAIGVASGLLKGVTPTTDVDAYQANVDAAVEAVVTGSIPTQNFNLTVGVDSIVGGSGNDIISGSYDAINALHTLSGLDTIDGGAGKDTLNLTDAKGNVLDLSIATAKNVEVLNISSVGAIKGTDGANAIKLTSFAPGLTDATITVKQGAGITVTGGTATELTVSNNHAITIVGGGGAVSAVTSTANNIKIGDAGGGAANANMITSATVETIGAGTVAVTDNSGTSGAIGATLTKVDVTAGSGTITLTGKAITDVSLTGISGVATLVNATAHALNLTVDGVTAGAEIVDDTATAINLTAATESVLIVDAGKATSLTVAAAEDLTLTAAGADYAALTKVTVTGAGVVAADLTAAAELVTVDASGSTGGIDISIRGTNQAAAGAAAQSVTGGAGDDTVTITATLGTGSTLSLGAGSDSVKIAGAGVIAGTAVVDAGDGNDMLALAIVGGANVGAFKNFEQFDVAGIATNFDQAVLNTKNTVTGFVGTDAVGADVTLQNLGAGVGFTVLGDMDQGAGTIVTLNQATGGALTIATDVDGAKGDGIIAIDAEFGSANAKSLTVNFGNDNVDEVANTAGIKFTNTVATAVTIDSNGSNVTNTFTLVDGVNKVAAVTVTGDQALVLTNTGTALASIDASGQSDGGLSFALAQLKSDGTIKLGAGDDIITASAITTTAVTSSTVQTLSGFEKGTEEGLAAQDGFDVIKFAAAAQAGDVTAAVGVDHSIKDGLYAFIGAGAPNLAAAVTQVNGDLLANETVVFEFGGAFYVYGQGATAAQTDDLLVKLVGVTSATGLDIAAATEVYVF